MDFSIHQELWNDCWLAATATARSRKRQVDLDVSQRVQRLLQDFGPGTSSPLTLRVYGTMIKGFCIINNERARCLFADCERIIIMFSRQPFADDAHALKLPAAKKKRVDALTLDLDITKVKVGEHFDWDAPLEEGAILQLQDVDEQVQAASSSSGQQEPSRLEQLALLDEAFPPADLPNSGPLDIMAEAARALQAPMQALGELAPLTPQRAVLPFELPPLEPCSGGSARKRRRCANGAGKAVPPGHILGFDNQTQLTQEEYEGWQLDEGHISLRRRGLAERVHTLPDQLMDIERLGPLRVLLDPCSEDLRLATTSGDAALALAREGGQGVAKAFPEVQELLAGEGVRPEMLTSVFGEPPEVLALVPAQGSIFGSGLAASRPDPFHPYSPEVPLRTTRGAAAELAEMLAAPPPAEEEGGCAGRHAPYDLQTARIGAVLKRSLGCGTDEAGERGVTFDDLIPPSTADQATAAKTFAALLVLATAGEFCVMQPMPYGPIAMSLT